MRKLILAMVVALATLRGAGAEKCANEYQKLAQKYYTFRKDSIKIKYHHNWEKIIYGFEEFVKNYPSCSQADDAQFTIGRLWYECWQISGRKADAINSLNSFSELLKKYPKSNLCDDALLLRGKIYLQLNDKARAKKEFEKLISLYPHSDTVKQAKKYLAGLKVMSSQPERAPPRANDAIALILEKQGNQAQKISSIKEPSVELLRIRYWSAPSYTRVVLDLSNKTDFTPPHLLRPDPKLKTPPRLYIDLKNTCLSEEFKKSYPYKNNCYELPIGDGLLRRARAGQYQPDVVRVVLDMQSIREFNYFALPPNQDGNWRVVLDVYGKKPESLKTKPAKASVKQPTSHKPKSVVIVIDPGHGGKDPGAIGPRGVKEKDVVLRISKYLARYLKQYLPQAKIILTRTDDRYLSLVERTARANALDADVFISIHCNANPDRRAYGIETYYLDNTSDRAVLRLAARENLVSEKVMQDTGSDINQILADLATTSKVNYSIPLAHSIQKALVHQLSAKYSYIKDLGVKKAPFWVLTGAVMPCVLVEVSFISNPREERRLASASYQQEVAKGIALGIKNWLKTSGTLTSVAP